MDETKNKHSQFISYKNNEISNLQAQIENNKNDVSDLETERIKFKDTKEKDMKYLDYLREDNEKQKAENKRIALEYETKIKDLDEAKIRYENDAEKNQYDFRNNRLTIENK